MQHVISVIRHIIVINDIRKLPEDGRRRFYPVLVASLRGENNRRRALTFMGWQAVIKTSQVRQCIVDIGIVRVGRVKWAQLGIFIFGPGGLALPPVPGFSVVGNINCTEAFDGSLPEEKTKISISETMFISEKCISLINLQFHEGLASVIAGQAKVHFDIVSGINVTAVTLGQHLVVHKVIE